MPFPTADVLTVNTNQNGILSYFIFGGIDLFSRYRSGTEIWAKNIEID